MKIRLLIFAGLLAGQTMPVLAMENPKYSVAKFAAATIAACINVNTIIRNVNQSINKSVNDARMLMHSAMGFMNHHPSLALGIVGLSIGSMAFWDRFGYDIKWKIGCYCGTIGPDAHLLRAAYNNNLKDALWALNRGANPDVNAGYCDRSPILNAIYANSEEMVDLLIKNGVDVNISNSLGYALQADNVNRRFNKSIAKKLIEAGADQNRLTYANAIWQPAKQFAQAEAARTRNPDYITIFELESKL